MGWFKNLFADKEDSETAVGDIPKKSKKRLARETVHKNVAVRSEAFHSFKELFINEKTLIEDKDYAAAYIAAALGDEDPGFAQAVQDEIAVLLGDDRHVYTRHRQSLMYEIAKVCIADKQGVYSQRATSLVSVLAQQALTALDSDQYESLMHGVILAEVLVVIPREAPQAEIINGLHQSLMKRLEDPKYLVRKRAGGALGAYCKYSNWSVDSFFRHMDAKINEIDMTEPEGIAKQTRFMRLVQSIQEFALAARAPRYKGECLRVDNPALDFGVRSAVRSETSVTGIVPTPEQRVLHKHFMMMGDNDYNAVILPKDPSNACISATSNEAALLYAEYKQDGWLENIKENFDTERPAAEKLLNRYEGHESPVLRAEEKFYKQLIHPKNIDKYYGRVHPETLRVL